MAEDVQLEARVKRLEQRLTTERQRGTRLRLTTSGMAAGVTAILVSMSLPWLGESSRTLEENIWSAPWTTGTSGWRFLWWALANPGDGEAGSIALAIILPLLALVAGLVALLTQAPTPGFAASIFGGLAAVALLLLLQGLHDNGIRDPDVTSGSGFVVAFAGCLAVVVSGAVQSRLRHLPD